jgi:hypothetical protein
LLHIIKVNIDDQNFGWENVKMTTIIYVFKGGPKVDINPYVLLYFQSWLHMEYALGKFQKQM